MYRIIKDYVYSHIDPKLPPEVNVKLHTILRYHPSGYDKTWYYKTKRWDGWSYVYDQETQRFRTGLAWRVALILERAGIPLEVIDMRKQHMTCSNIDYIKVLLDPYDFQLAAAKATLDVSHGIIASPTGTGKTLIMSLIAKFNAMKTLIVVNSRVLLDQTWDFFEDVVPGGAGVVGSGYFDLKDLTVATIQSLTSILGVGKKQKPSADKAPLLRDWLEEVGLVIHDEVHEADSKSVEGLYGTLKASKFIGTTATPFAWAQANEKGKNLEMEQHFGTKVYDSREEDFIKLGLTVPLFVNRFATPVADIYQNYDSSVRTTEEYIDVLANQIVDNDERIELLAKKVTEQAKSGLSCYVYYNRIKYGEKLCDAMHYLNPVFLQGKTTSSKRQKAFEAIEKKDILVIVSDIGSYGLNIKSLDSILVAFPTKDVRQLKGRVCRANGTKKQGFVLDPVDVVPYLKRHAQLRRNQYKKDGDTIIGY